MNIQDELKRKYQLICEKIPSVRILGLFLRGSQNYGLANQNSDIDTIALVFPSQESFIMNRSAENYIIQDGEHDQIQILDIRLFFHQLRKSSPNCLEILFTKCYYLNPDYYYDWEIIFSKREEIAYLNKNRLLKSLRGFICTNIKQFNNIPEKRCKKGYQILRIAEMVRNILKNRPYEECLICKDPYTKLIKEGIISTNESFILDIGEVTCLKIDSLQPFEIMQNDLLNKLQTQTMLSYMRRVF